MSEMKMKKQFSTMVVVEEIDSKTIRYHTSRLRKQLGLTTNRKFEFYTTNMEATQRCKFKFEEFGEDFAHPFKIEEVNQIDNMVAIFYKVNGKVAGFIYLFEISL